MTTGRLKLLTLNVNGMRKKYKKVFEYIHRMKCDLAFLQETHSTVCVEKDWREHWGGQIFFSNHTSRSAGVATLVKPGLKLNINTVHSAVEGRELKLDCNINQCCVSFVNVYVPNKTGDKSGFYKIFHPYLHKSESNYVILGGDFNEYSDSKIDREGDKIREAGKSKHITQVMRYHNLRDAWRIHNPGVKQFTWERKEPHIVRCTLDYIFISSSLARYARHCEIKDCTFSDHNSVVLDLNVNFDGQSNLSPETISHL